MHHLGITYINLVGQSKYNQHRVIKTKYPSMNGMPYLCRPEIFTVFFYCHSTTNDIGRQITPITRTDNFRTHVTERY